MHHAAGNGTGFVNDDGMAETCEVPCCRETARAGTDDQHALARRRSIGRDRPPEFERHVTNEPLDGMDAHRLVQVFSVAGVFARVIADASVDRRHGIVANDDFPRFAEPTGLGFRQPGLDVLARGARRIARGETIDIDRAPGTFGWPGPHRRRVSNSGG